MYESKEPAANNNLGTSTQPLDLPQRMSVDDTSEILTNAVDIPEDKNHKIVKTEEKFQGAVEENNTDFLTPQASKEVLRIETDDFTLTIERPQSHKTEPTTKLEQKPVDEDENSQILKTAKQQPFKTEQAQPGKMDETISTHVAVGITEIIHFVVKGDTLWDIAARYLGDPFLYPELAKLSLIKDPDLIYPGDLIRITIKKQPVMEKADI